MSHILKLIHHVTHINERFISLAYIVSVIVVIMSHVCYLLKPPSCHMCVYCVIVIYHVTRVLLLNAMLHMHVYDLLVHCYQQ